MFAKTKFARAATAPTLLAGAAVATVLLGSSRALADPAVGQADSFQDGTTQNWFAGGGPLGQTPPVPPANAPAGGPAGAGDRFLSLTATGGTGPGSRLIAINTTQWAGDYPAAGITAIEMDVNNFGGTDVSLRLMFSDPAGGPPTNMAVSTSPAVVPGGSGWMHVVFPIQPGDLTAVTGGAAVAVGNATEVRLYHSPTAIFPGPPIAAALGVDNIEAVPEPATAALATAGLLMLRRCRRTPRRDRAPT
jgi:hypothetical protein